MGTDNLLSARHLTRYYGNTCAVLDISFEVRRGEVLGFLGPNGAGKSTTMQMLTGNLAPSAGGVRINDVDLLEHPKQAKAALGYLPEQPPLYPELTVDEHLRYCARLHGVPRDGIASALAQTKARCGLTEQGRHLIGNLSKGFQQRVGIAQAIIHNPAVVILDEPTVGLDPIQIREIRGLIRDLGGNHSVILSTHILPEVQATCDRVQIIHQGELVLSDSIEGLTQRMASSDLVLGLRRPPKPAALETLEGVEAVETLGEGRFRLRHRPDTDPAEALAQRAVEADWGLFELTPERRTLEDIFVDITCTEREEAVA